MIDKIWLMCENMNKFKESIDKFKRVIDHT